MDDFAAIEPAVAEPQPHETLASLMAADNIAEMLTDSELARIGGLVIDEHDVDDESMDGWSKQMKRGIDLAKLIKDDKTYPFEKAANVKYPLITTAALQFNAKAYPAIVASEQIVKVKTYGSDPHGMKQARGDRVSAHMSWQLSAQIEEWEEETDKLLTLLPIIGTVVRKVWYDTAQKRIRCRIITPGAFIVNDKVKLLADAPRCSEVLPLYPSEIKERRNTGTFRDIDYLEENDGKDTQASEDFIEQHRRLDLDGDGYEEPYIVTVHKKSRKVARIVADFDEKDVTRGDPVPTGEIDFSTMQAMTRPGDVTAIRRGSYFVAYTFLPSLDGGFWGTGLGLLLGDISESINTIVNMMMDAGHMASRGGGWIGSGFRIKGGNQQFRPGEWKLAMAEGSAIKDNVVPMTFPGPDATLFQLLGLLIEAGKDVAAIKDVLTGETGGQQMTATTTLALIEQGMAQFTAAYKRIFRSLKSEFRLIARINAQTVGPEEYNAFHDETGPDGQPLMVDPRQDYNLADMDIVPVADPNSVTRMQQAAKAQVVMEMAKEGMVDRAEASKRMLEAAGISELDELAPKPDPMGEQMAQLQAQLLDAQGKLALAQGQLAQANAQAVGFKAQVDAQNAQLEPVRLQNEAAKLQNEAQGHHNEAQANDTEHMRAMMGAQADNAKAQLEMAHKGAEIEHTQQKTAIDAAKARADLAKKQAEIDAIKARPKAPAKK